MAACTSNAPASSTTVDCSGANATGVIAAASTNVTLNLLTGGSITPASGPSIWLGADADIRLQGGTITGNNAIANNYAVLIGDSSIVTLDGTIQSQGGIAGPLDTGVNYTSWLGISHANIIVGNTGKILTSGGTFNAGIYGRGGNNVYQIDGEITGSGSGASGIAVGNNDQITIGATGSITTLAGNTSDPIDGFGFSNVKVTTAAQSVITLHGIGRGIQVGADATVTVAGTIRSYGDTAIINSAGGVGIETNGHSQVWLKDTGQIITGNTTAPAGGLNNGGSGGIGISTWVAGASNSTVQIDGLIDTQKASGIFTGTGDDITLGSTGRITVRGSSNAVAASSFYVSPGNDQWSLDVGGRIEQLGTGKAIFLGANTGPDLHANVTVEEGGSLYAQSNLAYDEYDGAGTYGAIIDNLIVEGTIQRGNSGKAINLSDGADTITLFPTYSITGGVDGGSTTDVAQVDTFAFDGAANTSGTFDFSSIAVTNFEAGNKKGAGQWTLTGIAGTGINGIFSVETGRLAVNGTMTSTDFSVLSSGILGGTGTIKSFSGAGTFAPGNSIGTLNTATGAFGAGSTYEVEIDPTLSDKIVATGLVTIDPTAKVSVVAAPGTYADGYEYLILDAGTRSGTFGGVIDNSAFLDFTLNNTRNLNQVWLTIATVANFQDVAETPNQKAAASGLQELGRGNALFDAIAMLDADSARDAFDLSSGEIHAAAKGALLDDSRFVREAILDRLTQRFDDAFVATGPALGYAGEGAFGAAGVTRAALASGPIAAAWGQAFGSWGSAPGDGNAAAVSRSLGGFVAGIDATETGAWRFGAAFGVENAGVSVAERASSATVASYHLAAYGGIEEGPFALRFGGALTSHTLDTIRQDVFAGFNETLTAHYGAHTGQVFGEAAYEGALGGLNVEPFARVALVDVSTDGFAETGGLAALTAGPEHQSLALGSIGARFGIVLPAGDGAVKLNGLIAWQHSLGGAATLANLAFGGGTPFAVAGLPIARDLLQLNASVDWTLNPQATLGFAYSGQIGSGVQDHGIKARLAVRF
ncbi:hypothetical protein BH10PSE9_BH10PSE9_02790 [soil metagenome]